MDPKSYAQFMAMKEQAEKDAAATAAAAAAKPKPQAAPRPRPATGTPAAPKKAQPSAGLAPVKSVAQPATPKQTTTSAAPPVTDADEIAKQKSAFDADLMKDLKLDYLYDRARTAVDLDEALVQAAQQTRIPVQRYRELAAIQSIDLNDLDKQARSGMPFENYKQAKKGAIGFEAPAARTAMFDDLLKDYATAQKGEIRTDKRLELAPAEEATGLIPGFTTGYVMGHTTAEETPEVAKKGDHAYAVAEAYLDAIDKNPEVVHLVELYGNSFSAGATQKYINDRAQMLLRDRGIGPDSPEADRQAALARRQAMYEVLARKTVGQWTPAVFVKDVQVTDDAKAPDNPFAALYPNTELIGFNSKREAVFRQESPAGTILRALDVVGVVPIKKVPVPIPGQALMVGALTKGENETYPEAAARGVQTGANWLEYAIEETEDSSTAGKVAGRGLGFLGAVAHPDITMAAGAVNKSQKALRTTLATRKIAREADPILKRLVEAYDAQDFVTSNALEKEIAASETLGRDQKHGVAAGLNRADDAFSMALSYMDPTLKSRDVRLLDKLVTVTAARDPELAKLVYEVAGKGVPHLHFGVSAPEMAARSKSGVLGETFESFLDAGDFARHKERVNLARQAFAKAVPQTADEAIKRAMDDAIAAIGERAESAARMNAPGANFREEMELAKILESNRASILAKPEEWTADKARAILATNPVTGKDAAVKWRDTAAAQVAQIADRIKTIKTQNYQELVEEDMRIFDDMDRAIDANVKSRKMAAESMRRNLAKEANITITPVDILDDLVVEGTDRLSPMAQAQFFGTMRQLPPGSDVKGFFTAFQVLDAAKKAEAQRLGIPLEEAWRRWLIEVKAGRAQAPMKVKPVDVPLPGAPTPAAPSAATRAAATATPPAGAPPTPPAAAPAGSARALLDDVMAKLDPKIGASKKEVKQTLAAVDGRLKGARLPSESLPNVRRRVYQAVIDYLVDQKIVARSKDQIVKLTEKVEKAAKAAGAAPAATPPVRTPESFAAEIAAGTKFDSPEDLQFFYNNRAAVEAELKRLAPAATPAAPPAAAEEVTEATAKVAPSAPAAGPAMPRRNWSELTKQERNQLIDLGIRGDKAREAGNTALAAELNAQANAIWAPKARLPVMAEPRPAAVRPLEPELIRPTPEPRVITDIPELPPLPDEAAAKAAAKEAKAAEKAAAAEQKAIDTAAKAGLKKVAEQVNLHPKTTDALADLDAGLMAKPQEVSGILTELDKLPAGAEFPKSVGNFRKVVLGAIRDQMVKQGKVILSGKKYTIAGDLTPSVAKPVEAVAKAATKAAPSPEEALRQLGDAAETAVEQGLGGRFTKHPLSPREGLSSGKFLGGSDAPLEMDAAGNVILRRAADSIDSLTKEGKRKAELADLIDQNFSTRTFDNDAVSTTAEKAFVSRYGTGTMGPGRVVGTFKIPFQDLLEMMRRGEATLGNIGEAEVTLSGRAAKPYLSEVNDLPVAEARAAEAARAAETEIYIPGLAAETKAAPAAEAAAELPVPPTAKIATEAEAFPYRSLSDDDLLSVLSAAAAKLKRQGLPVPTAAENADALRGMLAAGGNRAAIARGALEGAIGQAAESLVKASAARGTEAVTEAVPVAAKVKPAATLENLGNRALWKATEAQGRIQAKVGGADFFISTVPADGKPPVFRVAMKTKNGFTALGGDFESLEDALRALTPTASGPAPLRAEINAALSSSVQKADITAKAAKQAAKEKELTPMQLLAREFNEVFGYEDLKSGVTTTKLKNSAYVAGERAAETGQTYEQAFGKYEEILRSAAKNPAAAEATFVKARQEFESGLKKGQQLLVAPVEAAAPTMSAAEKLTKAQSNLSKVTHVRMDTDGSATYGVLENGEFVPRYVVSSTDIRSGNAASVLFDQAVSDAPPAGLLAKAAGTVREVNMQPTLKKIEQLVGEGELFQPGLAGAAPRGGIRFLSEEARAALRMQDPPTAIITLFREVADPTTLVHEAGHYLRKMVLDQDDMDAVVRWVNRNGVNVTHEYGAFKGATDDINRAEELFADAFEAYMAKGKAPESRLQTLFERMKDVFAKVYRTLTKSAVNSDIDPEVKAVFDRLFSAVPDKQPESTFDLIMRHTFNNKGLEQNGALTVIANEAKRLGLPEATVEVLAKKVSQASKAQGKNWEKEVILDFPVEVLGKKKWTGQDILNVSERIQNRRNEFAMAPLKQALFGAPEETKATEQIYTALEEREEGKIATGTRFLARAMAKSIIGGDIVHENALRNLIPEIRRDLDTMPRIIGQAISDSISVLNQVIAEGDNQFLYKFLAGDEALSYTSGRRVISSGHEFIGGFMDMFRNVAATLSDEELAALQRFAQAINTKPDVQNLLKSQYRSEDLTRMLYPELNELGEGETIRRAMRQKTELFSSAIDKFRNLTGGGPTSDKEIGSRLAEALKGVTKEGTQPNINQYRFTETLLYLSGVTARDGRMFVESNKVYDNAQLQEAARILIEDTQKIFGSADDQLAARRLSIIVGAYGSAARAKAELAGLGLVLTKEEAAAYRNWSLGYGVTPEMRVKLEAVMRKFGANTEFVPDTVLGANVYIPQQARQRIADMLGKAQFSEQRLTPVGDIFLAVYSYTKKRMTRGNFVLRQRYFMVNTIDHFFQMSLIVGYAPAFQSMSRVALQNVMASLLGQGLETIARTATYVSGGRLSPAWIEKFRDILSSGGDKTAYWLRRMVSDSKYRLEVNDVLEGRNLPIVIGGHVTTGKRLREIFVAEGVFEAYNTRRLGQVVRKEGMAILEDGNGIFDAGLRDGTLAGNSATAWAKVKGAAEDILFGEMHIVDDLGDAWAERERVGAAITLIENGIEPRLACRLTIDALYDYGQSMTKMDRNWLVGLIFPFWAFQKNANQQFVNVLATPYGAYRMMVLKRFRDRGGELLTELYYDAVGGELGLDVKAMPQDMQDMYYAVMTKAHEVYGDEIPDDAKVALRMLLTNRDSEIIDGKVYELNADLIRKINNGGIAGVGGAGMSDYLLPRPNRSGLPSYLRDRPGVLMAQRRNAEVRVFSALNGRNDESYFLMLPEASFETAMKHTATVLSVALLMGGYATTAAESVVGGPMVKAGLPNPKEVLDLNERGLQGVDVLQAIKPVIDLERSPVAGPIIGLYAQRGYPQRVHPVIAKYLQNFSDVPILRVPAKMDPFEHEDFVLDLGQPDENGQPKDISQILGEDYMRTVQELNSKDIDLRDMSTIKEERFYLPPGGYSIAFENSPFLGELNKELLNKYDTMLSGKTTPETADDLGQVMNTLKNLTGLDVARVSAARTAQMEEPVFYTKSRKPF